MGSRGTVRALCAAVVVLGSAVAAFAQDYTVTQVSGQWKAVPVTAVDFGLTGDDVTKGLNPTPFSIPYYGQLYDRMVISTNGMVYFGGANTSGCCSPSAGPFSSGNAYDGICHPAWSDLYVTSGGLTSAIYYWTEGTAPNRTFVIAWLNVSLC